MVSMTGKKEAEETYTFETSFAFLKLTNNVHTMT
jgi:hypothetical protein